MLALAAGVTAGAASVKQHSDVNMNAPGKNTSRKTGPKRWQFVTFLPLPPDFPAREIRGLYLSSCRLRICLHWQAHLQIPRWTNNITTLSQKCSKIANRKMVIMVLQ